MIVIIEGPDGAGKSQLARQLASELNLTYHHEGVPPADVDPLYHYGSLLDQARDQRGVVFDRFALGERVYGPILRGRDGLGDDGWRVFTRLLWASGAHTILCLPNYETCRRNWASGRPELFHDEDKFKRTYDAWATLAQEEPTIDRLYDYTVHDIPWLRDKAALRRPVIGHPFGQYLLVGDRGSDPTRVTDLAFFGTTHSAKYLMKALDLAGYAEEELAWVNAFTVNGTPNPLPDHEQFKRVIALGAHAALECERQQLDYVPISHPAYWQRFHHHDMQSYVYKLKECR